MSEEMKLLTALCEAMGFEVKRNVDYQERAQYGRSALAGRKLKDNFGEYTRTEDGMYISTLIEPVISYEVVDRKVPASFAKSTDDKG